MSFIFSWPVRVYWEDTDAGGVVYHANYLKFMERARTEWLRQLGVDQVAIERETGAVLVIHSIECKFQAAARLNDMLSIQVIEPKVGGVRMNFRQSVVRESDQKVLVEAHAVAVCVNRENWRARRFPKQLTEKF